MTLRPILLDTCAAIWMGEPGALRPEAALAIEEASDRGVSVLISPMTAWEVGQLVARGRLALDCDPKVWFAGLVEEGVEIAPLSADALVDSSFLPSSPLRDPVDRILAATARAHGYRLMTRDGPLLAYARAGWLQALAC